MSAYMIWLNHNRETIKNDNPGISMIDISKKAGELWKQVTDHKAMIPIQISSTRHWFSSHGIESFFSVQKWEEKAAEAKREYDVKMKEYEKTKRTRDDDGASSSKKSPSKSSKSASTSSPIKAVKSDEFIATDDDTSSEDEKTAKPAKVRFFSFDFSKGCVFSSNFFQGGGFFLPIFSKGGDFFFQFFPRGDFFFQFFPRGDFFFQFFQGGIFSSNFSKGGFFLPIFSKGWFFLPIFSKGGFFLPIFSKGGFFLPIFSEACFFLPIFSRRDFFFPIFSVKFNTSVSFSLGICWGVVLNLGQWTLGFTNFFRFLVAFSAVETRGGLFKLRGGIVGLISPSQCVCVCVRYHFPKFFSGRRVVLM